MYYVYFTTIKNLPHFCRNIWGNSNFVDTLWWLKSLFLCMLSFRGAWHSLSQSIWAEFLTFKVGKTVV